MFASVGALGLAAEASASLARCALASRHIEEAVSHASNVMDRLDAFGSVGMESPARAAITCADVFTASGDPENARRALDLGRRELLECAGRITDDAMRSTFLEHVPEHHELLRRTNDHIASRVVRRSGGQLRDVPLTLKQPVRRCADVTACAGRRCGQPRHWCTDHLGSAPVAELFRSGHLSTVIGLRLADGREAVVKVRPASPRITACVEVQRRMFESGYPCPEPLGGPAPFGIGVATAESYVPGGDELPGAEHTARLSAEAFARLLGLAPAPADVSSLDPAPSWASWNHGEAGLWPRPEGAEFDLNEVDGPEWIDQAGDRARDRLRVGVWEPVIGHCRTGWPTTCAGRPTSFWSCTTGTARSPTARLSYVGFAAALYSTVSPNELATVEETDRFLNAYCDARGRVLSADEVQRSWAAGLWTRAYDAKYQHVAGHPITSLTETEARARLHRAAIDYALNRPPRGRRVQRDTSGRARRSLPSQTSTSSSSCTGGSGGISVKPTAVSTVWTAGSTRSS